MRATSPWSGSLFVTIESSACAASRCASALNERESKPPESHMISGATLSDITIKGNIVYIVEQNGTRVRAFDKSNNWSQVLSWNIPVNPSGCCPSLAYDGDNDVIWFTWWNSGNPTTFYALDPETGAVVNSYAPLGGHWGHGMGYTACKLFLGTETATPDGIRIYDIPCDGDGDGVSGNDNCPDVAKNVVAKEVPPPPPPKDIARL